MNTRINLNYIIHILCLDELLILPIKIISLKLCHI